MASAAGRQVVAVLCWGGPVYLLSQRPPLRSPREHVAPVLWGCVVVLASSPTRQQPAEFFHRGDGRFLGTAASSF